jgi:hypothetical protein
LVKACGSTPLEIVLALLLFSWSNFCEGDIMKSLLVLAFVLVSLSAEAQNLKGSCEIPQNPDALAERFNPEENIRYFKGGLNGYLFEVRMKEQGAVCPQCWMISAGIQESTEGQYSYISTNGNTLSLEFSREGFTFNLNCSYKEEAQATGLTN